MEINKDIWNSLSDRTKMEIVCRVYIENAKAAKKSLNTAHGSIALMAVEGYSATEIAIKLGNASLEYVKGGLRDIENFVTK